MIKIYTLFAYAFLNIVIGLWTLSLANTTVFADMQIYDAFVCGVATIFIVWGMMIIGTVVAKR
jgi:hypothetical protein|tara:strand:- start:291 stop:479 length:189 start_codon:yes stop_codon:yes gene_type:complete